MKKLQVDHRKGDTLCVIRCRPDATLLFRVRRGRLSRADAAKAAGYSLEKLPPCFGSDLYDVSEDTCSDLCKVRMHCELVFPKVKRSLWHGEAYG